MRTVEGRTQRWLPPAALILLTGLLGTSVMQGQTVPLRQTDQAWIGVAGERVPRIADASMVLEEARLRLAQLMPEGGLAAAQLAPSQTQDYVVGDRKEFWAINFAQGVSFPYKQYKVNAECRVVSANAYYFVELTQMDVATDEIVEEFAAAFEDSTPGSPRDPEKGIYQHVTEVFGAVPDVDGDPRVVVLLTDIPDAASLDSDETTYAGYFYSANQMADPVNFGGGVKQRSNFTELLYVDAQLIAYTGADTSVTRAVRNLVKSTIAHEFQHLVQFGQDPDEITAVNEGLSEYAAHLCGFGLRSTARYVTRPNVDMFSWQRYGETQDDYSRMAIWTYYLGNRFGDDFINAFAAQAQNGLAGLSATLGGAPYSTTFEAVYNDFLTALYMNDPSEGSGEFDMGFLQTWVEPAIHENLYGSSYPVTLEPYGGTVLRYWNSTGGLDITLPDGLPAGVTASLVAVGEAGGDAQALTSGGGSVPGLGTSYWEAGVVLTNGSGTRTSPFRITAAAAQGDTGLVRYETGRPALRIYTDETWQASVRIHPEVVPAKITGLWYFMMGNSEVEVAVRTMVANTSLPGTWIVNETPLFGPASVTPVFDAEGWLYVPLPDLPFISDPTVDYMVSVRAGENGLGYDDLTRYDPNRLESVRSFLRGPSVSQGASGPWVPLVLLTTSQGLRLVGNWMMRAEFAYQDTTAPDISLGLIQHPVFPDRADVYVAGTEPLHPGSSTGTLTPPGGSPLQLLFERTLGLRGLRGPAPVTLNTGTVSVSVEAFDRYGGLSDTAAIDVGVARIGEGQGASLFTAGESGAVGLIIPAGEHRGALLTLVSYPEVPAGMPEAPAPGQATLGSPLVSIGPATWSGPARGSELRIPILDPGEVDSEYHLERWNGNDWQSIPGSVQLSGGFARGTVTGGGWYRLAAGAAPGLPVARSGVEVLGNAPNPFNPETRIRFRIPPDLGGANVKLVVLNTRGQEVRRLVDGPLGSGLQEITWDGRNEGGHEVASGIYLYRLEVGNTVISRKMLLLR